MINLKKRRNDRTKLIVSKKDSIRTKARLLGMIWVIDNSLLILLQYTNLQYMRSQIKD
jgi:hypothetical protein